MIVSLALFTRLAGACAPEVAPGTLAALAAVESRFNTLAIYDNTTHEVLLPRDQPEAVAVAQRAIAAGDSVDLGLMQINSRNLAPLHLSVSGAFEPCPSLHAGAALLAKDYDGGRTPAEEQAALRAALSRYNTGTARGGFANGYVAQVISAAKRVVPEIDPGAATSAQVPEDWNVFPDSPGPGHLRRPRADRTTAPRAQRAQRLVGISAAPEWNVFPHSVGPDQLSARSPVMLTGHLSSLAETRGEDPNE